MSARTARRRRIQAVNNYSHLARLGHGNNNRPIYRKKSLAKQQRHEAALRARRQAMQARSK